MPTLTQTKQAIRQLRDHLSGLSNDDLLQTIEFRPPYNNGVKPIDPEALMGLRRHVAPLSPALTRPQERTGRLLQPALSRALRSINAERLQLTTSSLRWL